MPPGCDHLGKPRHIVSPWVVQVIVQEDGREQAEFERRARSEPLDDLPGTLIFFVGVGTDKIEIELIGVGFGEEVAAAGEVFQIEELVFFEAMHGFHVALVGVGWGWDAHVLAATESFGEVALELAAVVGLPDQIAERDAVAIQVLLDARGEYGAGRSAASFGEGPEEQAAAHVACGVLNQGKFQTLRLGPVAGDVVEIFGVGADLLEQSPAGLDVRQVLFALVFAAAFADEAMYAPDAFQGAVADGQIELADEAARAEGG